MTALLTAPATGRDNTPTDTFTATADLEILFATAVLTTAARREDVSRIAAGPRLSIQVDPFAHVRGWTATATVDRGYAAVVVEQRGGGVRVREFEFPTGDALASMTPHELDWAVIQAADTIPAVVDELIEEAGL